MNLAPGDLRKEGPAYDLPIALGSRRCNNARPLRCRVPHCSELSLSGETRPIKGSLAMARLAQSLNKKGILLPQSSAKEAALVNGIQVIPLESLDQAVRFLNREIRIEPLPADLSPFEPVKTDPSPIDFADVKGQHNLRRAIEIAVSGGHNLIMIGSPGSGKSMIAKRIPTIMPPPEIDEFLEILSIQSAAGITQPRQSRNRRPFRAPHHTISDVDCSRTVAFPDRRNLGTPRCALP